MNIKKLAPTLLIAAAFGILGQTNAQAVQLCSGTLSAFEAISPCSNGLFSLTFMPTGDNNAAVADTGITVTVNSTGPTELDVTYSVTGGGTFGLSGGLSGGYDFEYTVTFSNLALSREQMDILTPTITAGGTGSISGFKKLPNSANTQIFTPADTTIGTGPTLTANKSFPGLSTPQVVEDFVSLSETGTSVATTGNIVNTLNFVPEPLTTVLVGFGLLGFGLFRKRLSK